MKTIKTSLALLVATFVLPATSPALVGYANLTMFPGDNLIANQFDDGAGNSLNNLNSLFGFVSPAIPNNTTFTLWDPVTGAPLPVSTYNAGTGWSINYTLDTFASGRGGILNTPSVFTNMFAGGVVTYTNIVPEFGGIQGWHPNYSDGLYLIACPVPLGGPMDMMFSNVVDRLPRNGEWVKLLDPATQTYTTTTFHTGTGWDNGDPVLNVGQAAYFDLGPVPVPEPSSAVLICMVAAGLWATRGSCQKRLRTSLW